MMWLPYQPACTCNRGEDCQKWILSQLNGDDIITDTLCRGVLAMSAQHRTCQHSTHLELDWETHTVQQDSNLDGISMGQAVKSSTGSLLMSI
jgi:hypothetical protein